MLQDAIAQPTLAATEPARHRWSTAHLSVFAGAAVLLGLLFSLALLLRIPVVYMDEAAFSDAALSFAQTGKLGNPLFEALIPGMGDRMYWQPPLYPMLLAVWFKLGGFGIVQARVLSLLIGLGTVALVGLFALMVTRGREAGAIGAALLALDPVFGVVARTARMDGLFMLFTVASAALVLVGERRGDRRWAIAAGGAAALAFLCHPLGFLAGLTVGGYYLWHDRRAFGLAAIAAGLLLLPYAIYVGQDWASFAEQMGGQLARKGEATFEEFWGLLTWPPQQLPLKVIYVVVCLVVIWRSLRSGRRELHLVGLLGLNALVWPIAARQYGLTESIFFAAIALGILCSEVAWLSRRKAVALVALVALLSVASSGYWVYKYAVKLGDRGDYYALTQELSNVIPSGSRVFIAVVYPDPYFTLRARGDVQLTEWLPIPIPTERYVEALRHQDYVIFSGSPDSSAVLAARPIIREELLRGFAPIAAVGTSCADCYELSVWQRRQ